MMRLAYWPRFALLLAAISLTSIAAFGDTARSAVDEFTSLTKRMHDAKVHGSWQTFDGDAATLSQFLNGSPDALLEVARARVHVGDTRGALKELQAIASM